MKKLLLVLALVACGREESNSDSGNSDSDNYFYDPARPDFSLPEGEYEFRAGSVSAAGLTAKAFEPVIRACMNDSSNSASRKQMVKSSIMKWFEPLREISDRVAVDEVQIVGWNSGDCDVYVAFGNYNPARTQMGSVPKVYMANSGWYGSSTVTLHEFGHAFGLLDTYNGRGGSCMSGQPASVMCYAKYNELLEDDRLGVQAVFKRLRLE